MNTEATAIADMNSRSNIQNLEESILDFKDTAGFYPQWIWSLVWTRRLHISPEHSKYLLGLFYLTQQTGDGECTELTVHGTQQ